MKLIVGLGNPGPQYERTRHNVGFLVVDQLARRFVDPATGGGIAKARFSGLLLEASVQGERVLLLKPTVFMNRSGQSIIEALQFYKLDPVTDLLVLVDDLALPVGAIRLRSEGGAGGHNGLTDIISRLGNPLFARCRIGIDSPERIPQKDYVLGRFTSEQQEMIEPALEDATRAAAHWVANGIEDTMNRFNRRTEQPAGPAADD